MSTYDEFLKAQIKETLIPTVEAFIRIENQSRNYDPNWETDGWNEKVCQFAIDFTKKIDLKTTTTLFIQEAKRTPCVIVVVEPEKPDPSNPNILMYGHLDKQPPLTEQWTEGLKPYVPEIREGKLYGRGGADDGYAFFTSALILKALQKFNLLNSRVVLFFETDEESGSKDLIYFLEKNQETIKTPNLLICLDSGCADYNHLYLTSTLRGVMNFTLKVEVMKNGVHSGMGSGIVPDSFRIARKIVEQFEVSDNGQLLLQDLYVNVPDDKYKQAYDLIKAVGGKIDWAFPFLEGVHPTVEDGFQQYMNRIWMPQLTLIGMDGVPDIKNAGNVLRPYTTLGFSLRLPPTLDAEKAKKSVVDFFNNLAKPYNAKVEVTIIGLGPGFNAPEPDPKMMAILDKACQKTFGKSPLFYGEGGSIPFIGELYAKFPKSQFIVTGVLGPKSNAHGPNEFLHLDFLDKLTFTIGEVLKEFKL